MCMLPYDSLDLLEALFLHVGEDRHVEDEPLEEGGDRVRPGQQHRRQRRFQILLAALSVKTENARSEIANFQVLKSMFCKYKTRNRLQ